MTLEGPIAVTGARGRLGRALLAALEARGVETIAWSRPEFDLDAPDLNERLVDSYAPATVIHTAAWTDVDACAQDPARAQMRNGYAVGRLALACARRDIGLLLVSTNEVFDGTRSDGQPYAEDDVAEPINPYGDSKLAAEQLAQAAFEAARVPQRLWIVRTAWLYGPPGNDFPSKIVAAADRQDGAPLGVVADEVGSPTYTLDLAAAMLRLLAVAPAGTYHLVGGGQASRADFARAVLARCRPAARVEPIASAEYVRGSRPPAWSVLGTQRALAYGIELRDWRAALADYLDQLC